MRTFVRRSWLSVPALALAGAAAFALFVRQGDRAAPPAARNPARVASLALPPARTQAVDAAPRAARGSAGAAVASSRPEDGTRSAGPAATGDWRASPRLWLFTAEDRDRVGAMLAALATAVRDANWKEVESLTKAFKALGARAVAPLLDTLLRDQDDRMRIYAAALLGDIQESVPGGILREALRVHGLPLLEEVAATAEEPSMRHSALVAMARIGDPSSFGFLADSLRRNEGWPLVGDAIRGLAAIRGDGVTAEIADLAGRESDPRLRERLVRALGEREDPAALGTLQELATRDLDPGVRAAAAQALGTLGTPASARALRAIAGGSDEAGVRAAAVSALGRPGDAGDVDGLRGVLGSGDDPEVRSAAWRALREIGTPEAQQVIARYRPAVRVDGVIPGTQAARLSLSANDVITSYDGKPVRDAGTLRGLVLSTSPERVVTLVVDRGGWTSTVLVHGGLLGIQIEDGVVLD